MLLRRITYLRVLKLYKRPILQHSRCFSSCSKSNINILGIETSCDDTGCAVINGEGKLLSETIFSQNVMHLRNGGIIPDIAQDLHRTHIKSMVDKALEQAQLSMEKITAIAVTVKPGLPLSLAVGLKYAKHLARRFKKPIIPIHHMQAHALVSRMHNDNVQFPFLVLLISGGHCLLAVAEDIDKFKLLGLSMDCAPGEIFDKAARRMKLRNLPEYAKVCGGQAIETAAQKATNPHQFQLPLALAEYKDCNFSFNGIKTSALYHLYKKEQEHKTVAHELIPEINDLCAAMLIATTRHLVHRTQRAMLFCQEHYLISKEKQQLIVSGGVACNNYIFNALQMLCDETSYKIYRPPHKLCTDNGVMIAWNGLEKWRHCIDIFSDFNSLDIEASSPLGENFTEKVVAAKISTKVMKIKLKSS